jgi:hypothetical protein
MVASTMCIMLELVLPLVARVAGSVHTVRYGGFGLARRAQATKLTAIGDVKRITSPFASISRRREV